MNLLSQCPWLLCASIFLLLAPSTFVHGDQDAADDQQTQKQKDESNGQVVITATRIETPIEESGSAITVIGAQDMHNRQQLMVGEALQFSPGVDIRRSGGRGSQTSIFTRGTDSDHTLLMVDGIRLTDPSLPTSAPFIDDLTIGNIDRIEILRGPQSTLYGSDAIGGVINVISPKGSGPATFGFGFEAGSHQTVIERFTTQAGFEHLNYSFSVSRFDIGGFSATTADSERDPYRNTSLAGRIGFEPTDLFGVDLFLRHSNAQIEIDSGADPGISDSENDILLFKVQPHWTVIEDVWEQKLGMWVTDIQRDNKGTGFSLPSSRKGTISGMDWQNNIFLDTWDQVVTFGVEYREEEAEGEQPFGAFEGRTRNLAFFLQDQFRPIEPLTLTAGLRVDNHDDFGSETTYRLTGAYTVDHTQTTIRSSYGTGFKAPSLAELFDATFGSDNPNLDPESSHGFDVGIEQPFDEGRWTFGTTYFYNDIDDMIVAIFDSNSGNFVNTNVEQVMTQGVEIFILWKPAEHFQAKASYTYTDTEAVNAASFGISDKSRLLRRPLHKASLDLTHFFAHDRGSLTLTMLYVGIRDDLDPVSFSTVEADDYFVVNASGRFRICDHVELFGRVENIFDQEYEDVLGFATSRAAAYAGVSINF